MTDVTNAHCRAHYNAKSMVMFDNKRLVQGIDQKHIVVKVGFAQ